MPSAVIVPLTTVAVREGFAVRSAWLMSGRGAAWYRPQRLRGTRGGAEAGFSCCSVFLVQIGTSHCTLQPCALDLLAVDGHQSPCLELQRALALL